MDCFITVHLVDSVLLKKFLLIYFKFFRCPLMTREIRSRSYNQTLRNTTNTYKTHTHLHTLAEHYLQLLPEKGMCGVPLS